VLTPRIDLAYNANVMIRRLQETLGRR